MALTRLEEFQCLCLAVDTQPLEEVKEDNVRADSTNHGSNSSPGFSEIMYEAAHSTSWCIHGWYYYHAKYMVDITKGGSNA